MQNPLDALGLCESAQVYWNLEPAALIEQAIQRNEGALAANGALVVRTGKFTGRSPRDKYIVEEPSSREHIWWGTVNRPLSEESFERLLHRLQVYLKGKTLYAQDLFAGADSRYRLPVRVINEYAWHNLFARQVLLRPALFPADAPAPSEAPLTILCAPGCQAIPSEDGTTSETFVALHLAKRLVLIGGTEYAGEIKKSVFTVLNYLLPQKGFFPMHCAANIGRRHGDTALFFGLSGTGKTTLSADPIRDLIGDDEHGWTDDGIYNFEGGCYAKCIRLNPAKEPEIWDAIRFGSVLENVVMDAQSRRLDFDNDSFTENTRAAYPVDYIPHARVPGLGGHPKNILFLTADAFGVLPPLSKLTPAQARFQFLSGYTAKLAGTERGMGSAPQATFSACFGMPFLPLHPTVYAELLGRRLEQHEATVWLVNTGWSGGGYGVGARMDITHTRALVDAAIEGVLDNATFHLDPIFGLLIPDAVPGVPDSILNPRNTWPNPASYDQQARTLAQLFIENFEQYRHAASPEVIDAAPRP